MSPEQKQERYAQQRRAHTNTPEPEASTVTITFTAHEANAIVSAMALLCMSELNIMTLAMHRTTYATPTMVDVAFKLQRKLRAQNLTTQNTATQSAPTETEGRQHPLPFGTANEGTTT